jgi:hypothetical protein
MAAMNTKSVASTPLTIAPDTIKSAFREIMDDEAKHVSFFEAALKKAGAPPDPSRPSKAWRNRIRAISLRCLAPSRIPA